MPELPEVETIRLGLKKYLIGHNVIEIEVNKPKMFVGDKKDVIGAKITDINRIGKGLIIELDNDFCLAIHLKMTGQLIYQDKQYRGLLSPKTGGEKLPSKYTHIIFLLNNDAFLYYNDLRQFGWIKVVRKDKILQMPFFKEMGPEPSVAKAMEGQVSLTEDLFRKIISTSSTKIKPFLMDQKKIGGIGNIYANEALFGAGIDPRRSAKSLNSKEIEKLYEAVVKVLKKALDDGGSSDENFVNALGQEGNYQNHFLVYNRKGKECPRNDGVIQKIKLAGRGTYFCPSCQK